MTIQGVLPGYGELTKDLRQVVCECGCGMAFMQRRVGRVRKYMNDVHKAHAAKVRKAEQVVMVGDAVADVMRYLDLLNTAVPDEEHTGLRRQTVVWLQTCAQLFTVDMTADAINDIQAVYCMKTPRS